MALARREKQALILTCFPASGVEKEARPVVSPASNPKDLFRIPQNL